MFKINSNKAFTLTEILSVVVILGIIATLIVPTLVKRNIEKTNRIKLKKAYAAYEKLVNQLVIENNLRSNELLNDYITRNNCSNAYTYFKATEQNGCIFKTSDNLWWDIGVNGNFTKPIVAFKRADLNNPKNALTDNNYKAFYFTTNFDNNGILRILDTSFGYDDSNSEYIMATAKTLAYINDKNMSEFIKYCPAEGKKESCYTKNTTYFCFFDKNGNCPKFLYNGCDKKGINCSESRIPKFFNTDDEHIEVRIECGLQGATCDHTHIYAGPKNPTNEEKKYFTDLIKHLRPDFDFDENSLSYERVYKCDSVTEDYNNSSCNHVSFYLHVVDKNGKSHSLDGSNTECYTNPTPGCQYRDYYDWQWFIWED